MTKDRDKGRDKGRGIDIRGSGPSWQPWARDASEGYVWGNGPVRRGACRGDDGQSGDHDAGKPPVHDVDLSYVVKEGGGHRAASATRPSTTIIGGFATQINSPAWQIAIPWIEDAFAGRSRRARRSTQPGKKGGFSRVHALPDNCLVRDDCPRIWPNLPPNRVSFLWRTLSLIGVNSAEAGYRQDRRSCQLYHYDYLYIYYSLYYYLFQEID